MAIDEQQLKQLVEQITRQVWQQWQATTTPPAKHDIPLTGMKVARLIDHTLLKPQATPDQIRQLCRQAQDYHFASVCVNPGYVSLCADLLHRTDVKVGTTIGFPLGATTTAVKVFETKQAIVNGTNEVDMVLNVGALKTGDVAYVKDEIAQIVTAAHAGGALIKVILETCLLTDDEKVIACKLCQEAGADFVKTSTGFSTGGATVEDVALMRQTVGPEMGVKASGGIRNYETLLQMVEAGATRIGASAGVAIVKEALGGSASAPTGDY